MAVARPLRFDNQGWLVGVRRVPGPSWKTSGNRPRTTGGVSHSMEGWKDGGIAVIMGARSVSWHGSIYQNGEMDQHYQIQKWCWHAKGGNSWLWGFEYEGRTGIPLTRAQLLLGDELYDAYQDYVLRSRLAGWELWRSHTRTGAGKNLWEHNEVPSSATACPSERMRPLWPLVISPRVPSPVEPPDNVEEDTLSSAEFQILSKRIDGTNNMLRLVGDLAQENSQLTKSQQAQINFLIFAMNTHADDDGKHTGTSAPSDEVTKELEEINESIEEIEARMKAASDALVGVTP